MTVQASQGHEPGDTPSKELDRLIGAAADAARVLVGSRPSDRANWLDLVASRLDAATDDLVPLAARETHLGVDRLQGELKRTTFQLRLFAEILRDGSFLQVTIDHANPTWPMGPRPDLRRMLRPIGPVAVFAASNFPFAFSVAGGDTASALAAGGPVVLKAHPSHPELSAATGTQVAEALQEAGAPEGIFAVVMGYETGIALVKDPRIRAAAFTGSLRGGRALFDLAVSRPDRSRSTASSAASTRASSRRRPVSSGPMTSRPVLSGPCRWETASFAPSLDCCSFRQVPASRTASRPWPESGPWRRC